MIPIVRIPESLQRRFFDDPSLRSMFSKPQGKHFQEILLALILAFSRRTIKAQAALLGGTARTTLGEFYPQSPVDTEGVLRHLCFRALAKLGVKKGDVVDLILDDSPAKKRGKKMEGSGKYYDAALRAYLHGHNFIAAAVATKKRVIPFDVRLAYKRVWAKTLGFLFRTLSDLAVILIDAFAKLADEMGIYVHVLFDSYYMNKKVACAVDERGMFYVWVLASNRVVKIHGRRTHLGEYRRCIPKKDYRKVRIPTEEGKKDYGATGRRAYLPKIGEGKIVFSKRTKSERALALVTNAWMASVATLIEWYRRRWAIEVHFFKAAKQLLGLAEYQTGKAEGIEKHLRLVACVYALLATETLGWEGKAKTPKTKRRGCVVKEARDAIRREVFEDLLDFLEESNDPKAVVRELRELMRMAA